MKSMYFFFIIVCCMVCSYVMSKWVVEDNEEVEVLVAKKDLEKFTSIKNPQELFEKGSIFKKSAPPDLYVVGSIEQLKGRTLKRKVWKGTPITDDDLLNTGKTVRVSVRNGDQWSYFDYVYDDKGNLLESKPSQSLEKARPNELDPKKAGGEESTRPPSPDRKDPDTLRVQIGRTCEVKMKGKPTILTVEIDAPEIATVALDQTDPGRSTVLLRGLAVSKTRLTLTADDDNKTQEIHEVVVQKEEVPGPPALDTLRVPIGGTRQLQMKGKQRISLVSTDAQDIVSLSVDVQDSSLSTIFVQGLAVGKARVTLTADDENKTEEIYDIVVHPDR